MAFTNKRAKLLAGIAVLAGGCLAPSVAQAQDVRLEGFGGIARDERPIGATDDGFSGGVLPSVAFDLGETVAFQVDGMAAEHLDTTVLAAAVHLAIRPAPGASIGVYAAYADHDTLGGLASTRIGAEAVLHLDRFSLAGIAGYEHTEQAVVVAGGIPGFTIVDSYGDGGAFFSIADVTAYPDDNWSIAGGHRYIGGRHAAALGSEAAFRIGGASAGLFAEGRIGEGDYRAIWAGLRIRFGAPARTLRERDRDEGFANRLKDELFGLSNTRRRSQVALPPPPPPEEEESCPCGPCYVA